jgi:hypothetical protein
MADAGGALQYVYEYETHVDYRGELVKSGHVRP